MRGQIGKPKHLALRGKTLFRYMDVHPMNDAVLGAGEDGEGDGGYMVVSPVFGSDSNAAD